MLLGRRRIHLWRGVVCWRSVFRLLVHRCRRRLHICRLLVHWRRRWLHICSLLWLLIGVIGSIILCPNPKGQRKHHCETRSLHCIDICWNEYILSYHISPNLSSTDANKIQTFKNPNTKNECRFCCVAKTMDRLATSE